MKYCTTNRYTNNGEENLLEKDDYGEKIYSNESTLSALFCTTVDDGVSYNFFYRNTVRQGFISSLRLSKPQTDSSILENATITEQECSIDSFIKSANGEKVYIAYRNLEDYIDLQNKYNNIRLMIDSQTAMFSQINNLSIIRARINYVLDDNFCLTDTTDNVYEVQDCGDINFMSSSEEIRILKSQYADNWYFKGLMFMYKIGHINFRKAPLFLAAFPYDINIDFDNGEIIERKNLVRRNTTIPTKKSYKFWYKKESLYINIGSKRFFIDTENSLIGSEDYDLIVDIDSNSIINISIQESGLNPIQLKLVLQE